MYRKVLQDAQLFASCCRVHRSTCDRTSAAISAGNCCSVCSMLIWGISGELYEMSSWVLYGDIFYKDGFGSVLYLAAEL